MNSEGTPHTAWLFSKDEVEEWRKSEAYASAKGVRGICLAHDVRLSVGSLELRKLSCDLQPFSRQKMKI